MLTSPVLQVQVESEDFKVLAETIILLSSTVIKLHTKNVLDLTATSCRGKTQNTQINNVQVKSLDVT